MKTCVRSQLISCRFGGFWWCVGERSLFEVSSLALNNNIFIDTEKMKAFRHLLLTLISWTITLDEIEERENVLGGILWNGGSQNHVVFDLLSNLRAENKSPFLHRSHGFAAHHCFSNLNKHFVATYSFCHRPQYGRQAALMRHQSSPSYEMFKRTMCIKHNKARKQSAPSLWQTPWCPPWQNLKPPPSGWISPVK